MTHGADLQQVGDQIEQLLDEVRSMVSPAAWERVDRLVRSIVELYGTGLRQVVTLLPADEPAGRALRARLLGDPLVASLLLLHGLHPDDLATRVQQALERVRPYLGSHGGDVEIVGTDEERGVVRLRMKGSCDGCPSSAITVKHAVEGAIRELAPDAVEIEVEGLDTDSAATAPQAPNGGSGRGTDAAATWVALGPSTALEARGVTAAEVRGARIVLCRVDERLYAYRNRCPSCGSAIDGASLDGAQLACPACGQCYDVRRAGRAVERREIHLDPLPLLEDGGHIKVALPAP
jgi:Fe-S cluster biogenesis protein NfuA/nitrite reductase/ring-hydroxylating ferredoxin subunit